MVFVDLCEFAQWAASTLTSSMCARDYLKKEEEEEKKSLLLMLISCKRADVTECISLSCVAFDLCLKSVAL